MIRNRVHVIIDRQRNLELPVRSDLLGKKGLHWLRELKLENPDGLLLRQCLDLHDELALQIRALEDRLEEEYQSDEVVRRLRTLPGVGPILGAVIATEVDGVGRFIRPDKLYAYAGLASTTHASGGHIHNGRNSLKKTLNLDPILAAGSYTLPKERLIRQVRADRAIFGESQGSISLLGFTGDQALWRSIDPIEMDLPASVPAGLVLKPFFRGWPGKNGYYLGRTEPDHAAARRGMVRTKLLHVPSLNGEIPNVILAAFTELMRPWSPSEVQPLDFDTFEQTSESTPLRDTRVINLAHQLATDSSANPVAVPETFLVTALPLLWEHAPTNLRHAISFGYSFTAADLRTRRLDIVEFPVELSFQWTGYANLFRDAADSGISTAAGYLLGLPEGASIDCFVSDGSLPNPTLRELPSFVRMAEEWEHRSDLDFNGWAALLKELSIAAPESHVASDMKKTAVSGAASTLRSDTADDVLVTRGFSTEALAGLLEPLKLAVQEWFTVCLRAEKSDGILRVVLNAYDATKSQVWRSWVDQAVKPAFGLAPDKVAATWWRLWDTEPRLLATFNPSTVALDDSESIWVKTIPRILDPNVGTRLLEFCQSTGRWWVLHAKVSVRVFAWETAFERHHKYAGPSTVWSVLCESITLHQLAQLAVNTDEPSLRQYAGGKFVHEPAAFQDFTFSPGWVAILRSAVKLSATLIGQLPNQSAILFQIVDAALGRNLETDLLKVFANHGSESLLAYPKRDQAWLIPDLRALFLTRTARDWLRHYFLKSQMPVEFEPKLQEEIGLLAGHPWAFASESEATADRGRALFDLIPQLTQTAALEWMKALAGQTVSSDLAANIGKFLYRKKWWSAAGLAKTLARSSGNSGLRLIVDHFEAEKSVIERLLGRFDMNDVHHIEQVSGPLPPLGSGSEVSAVFITALPVEFNAVRQHLDGVQEESKDGGVYSRGVFKSGGRTVNVIVAQSPVGNPKAAVETLSALREFKPRFAFFVGVACGLKEDDSDWGDVVVADKIYYYESGKVAKKFLPRPQAPEIPRHAQQRAMATVRDQNWQRRVKSPSRTDLKSFYKPILSGEKLLAVMDSSVGKFVMNNYGDAYALAMEDTGFITAAAASGAVFAVVRGISDFGHDKAEAEKSGSQDLAANTASAFAFEMLAGFLR